MAKASQFMGSGHVEVIDISSDEEDVNWTETEDIRRPENITRRKDSFSADLGGFSIDLTDLDSFPSAQEESHAVVVVDKLSVPPAKRRRKGSGHLGSEKGGRLDEDDDDCVVLEVDPNKPVLMDGDVGAGEDELLIVGEKGELACRDYPHSRHQCAKFPFSSSPHEKYCDLCHCYVCDSPAPCSYWNNGSSRTDHCHSTDKDGRWKLLRKSFKQKNMEAALPKKITDYSSFSIPLHQDAVPLSNPYPLSVPHCIFNSLLSSSTPIISNSNTIKQRNCSEPTILPCHSKRPGSLTTLNPSVKHAQRNSCIDATSTTQRMYSRTRFKSPPTMQAGLTRLESPSCNTLSRNKHFPINVPISSRRPWCPEVGQHISEDLLPTSPGHSAGQIQATLSYKSVSSTNKGSTCSLLTTADINQKNWQGDSSIRDAPQLGVVSSPLCRDKSRSKPNSRQE
ncbi:hypothetical protein Cni_G18695 [Canna indica]|uniref:Uncharacterized protein n=1 Tax=Canna indica TaxID=4628 RepID=A0AAQ3KQ62_9LILI|nr:hypothetical protein Cni_G18695 [Canna indica]